jgi:hypothetical protein
MIGQSSGASPSATGGLSIPHFVTAMAPSPVINLDHELDRLFQAPFAEFVGARNGVAAMLKKAGRVDESTRVRGLAKPSYTAWLVNQLYWNARDEFDTFVKAADRVRAAEHAMLEGRKAGSHPELVAARAAALEQLMTRAAQRAAEEGTPLSPALGERLKTTLDAIGAYGSGEAKHHRGRLQEDLDPPGFAAFAALASGAKPAPSTKRAAAPPPEPPRLVVGRSIGVDHASRQAAADARAALQEALTAAGRAQDAAAGAADAERKARAAMEAAKARLAEVERARKSAEAEVSATTAALKARQAEARKAAAEAAAAQKAVDKARDRASTAGH